MNIKTIPGGYIVVDNWKIFTVDKNKNCTCNQYRHNCKHVRAVAEYLKNGGERAPQKNTKNVMDSKKKLEKCPVCEEEIIYENKWFWACKNERNHYWKHRGETCGAKEFFLERDTGIPAIDNLNNYGRWLNKLEKNGGNTCLIQE